VFGVLFFGVPPSPLLAMQPRDESADGPHFHAIRHVLLISIDGMHSIDFANCEKGISGVNGGEPYCPDLASLAQNGVSYLQAFTPEPSDSFPGLTAQITGGTPRSAGMFYDISYDRHLSPPAKTTPYGIVGGADLCPAVQGTQVGFDEQIDYDYTKLDGGGGIDPDYLPRDPNKGCAPVYPHNYIRVNTIFEVIRKAGGYTAWSDKHPSYDFTNGPSGKGVNDFYGPEINSIPVPLPDIQGCDPLPDQTAVSSDRSWTDSFQNIQYYDSLKVDAVLNWIGGKSHDGSSSAPVPSIFGMNFQSVSVGQKLNEVSNGTTGGYSDSVGTPSAALLNEIEYVDDSIGKMVDALRSADLLDSTLIIVSAKHGQSPVDPNRLLRIPRDDNTLKSPSSILDEAYPELVAQTIEDDVSLIWLTDQSQTSSAAATLEANEGLFGGGQIFSGPALALKFNSPLTDSRSPDIAVAPNVGIVYTGKQKKVAEHGGFTYDDRNVMLLVSNRELPATTFTGSVETRQIAPTILGALGLDPDRLQAVRMEHTQPLPQIPIHSTHRY